MVAAAAATRHKGIQQVHKLLMLLRIPAACTLLLAARLATARCCSLVIILLGLA
jgi:hypothetical protein